MADFFVDSNGAGSRELFEKRIYYRNQISQLAPSITNFNFGEKYFYGRVDRHFVPIVVKTNLLEQFKADLVEGTGAGDLNFVVRAFNDVQQQFKKCAMTRKIATDDPFLSNLRVYGAIASHRTLYSDHLAEQFNLIKRAFEAQPIRVRNFEQFMDLFLKIKQDRFYKTPFTKPAFIKSALCPLNASGLVIEIADIEADNDAEKIEKIVRSKNWNFFINACNSYGFMVDENVPYRMVADIGSAYMLHYASQDNFYTTDHILDEAYQYAHDEYFPHFKYYLLRLYNKVRTQSFLERTECEGHTVIKKIAPKKYSKADFDALFHEKQFVYWYCKIRLLEETTSLRPDQQEVLIDDVRELHQSNGVSEALKVFELIINKPFDYSGSLGYIYNKLRARADASPGKHNVRSATSPMGGGKSGGSY